MERCKKRMPGGKGIVKSDKKRFPADWEAAQGTLHVNSNSDMVLPNPSQNRGSRVTRAFGFLQKRIEGGSF